MPLVTVTLVAVSLACRWVNAKQVRFSDLVNCHLAK